MLQVKSIATLVLLLVEKAILYVRNMKTLLLQYYPTLKITMYLRLPLNYLMA